MKFMANGRLISEITERENSVKKAIERGIEFQRFPLDDSHGFETSEGRGHDLIVAMLWRE